MFHQPNWYSWPAKNGYRKTNGKMFHKYLLNHELKLISLNKG